MHMNGEPVGVYLRPSRAFQGGYYFLEGACLPSKCFADWDTMHAMVHSCNSTASLFTCHTRLVQAAGGLGTVLISGLGVAETRAEGVQYTAASDDSHFAQKTRNDREQGKKEEQDCNGEGVCGVSIHKQMGGQEWC
uniref:Uncharacterized protein n=1 Tax=Eutreptiella gymnastica TaxID=73025 RepID=A0A7S4D373_9EUGL